MVTFSKIDMERLLSFWGLKTFLILIIHVTWTEHIHLLDIFGIYHEKHKECPLCLFFKLSAGDCIWAVPNNYITETKGAFLVILFKGRYLEEHKECPLCSYFGFWVLPTTGTKNTQWVFLLLFFHKTV